MDNENVITQTPKEAVPMAQEKQNAQAKAQKARRLRDSVEWLVKNIFFLCGIVAVASVLFISVYLVISGLPAILEIGPINFLFGTRWYASTEDFGIFAIILTSFAGTGGAILIGVPVGVLTAMFLAKVANHRLAAVIRSAVSLLAGIPSVVYGLVGMVVLVPAVQKAFHLSSGANLLAAIVVLTVMILPSIINVAETALRAVPKEYEERPPWPWVPPTPRPSSGSLSPPPVPVWPPPSCWALAVPLARPWPLSWSPATWPICPRTCLPPCASSPPPSPRK